MSTLFILSLLVLVYIYLGYPVLLFALSKIRRKEIRKDSHRPTVTILIAAYNEEKCIEATIRNKIELNYPKDNLDVIVISDGSSDDTDRIVKEYESTGVRLIRQEPRAGKTSALNKGVSEARGEILVFSDANSIYAPDALGFLVENFYDEEVGYVTGKMIYVNSEGSVIGDGCSSYMRYENALRTLETRIGSVVGVDGGIDAVRKFLYQPMNQDQLPDFILPLKVIEQGYRVVYEPKAILKEQTLKAYRDEYRMRVRVSLRALWALGDMKHLLNVQKYGLFSWQLFSHKHLRYMAYLFIVSAYVSNLLLLYENSYYYYFFMVQNAWYGSALIAFLLDKTGFRCRPLYIPYYFFLINLASANATFKFLCRQKQVLWTPRKG